jgi:hypothetical protein
VVSVRDDEPDPTGMRELLRALPGPGPMPDDLVARIQTSLADLDPLTGRTERPHHDDVPRETTATGRGSWLTRHGGKLAVAAVLVVGGGAVANGQLGLLGGADEMTSGSAVGGSAENQRGAGSDTSADADGEGAGTVAGPVVVRLSARTYTSAGLATQLQRAEAGPRTGPLTAESPASGPIGSEIGVRSCLEALGLPRDTGADVDLALVDGAPAAVLVVTVGGERTAYAVGRDCTTGNPSLIAGPVPVR